jgi:adenine-specific DNA-methyltransferase
MRIKKEPIWMLNLTREDYKKFPAELLKHISYGENQELHKRYKCGKRNRWYDVPIISNGQLMFFKRYNKLPRIVVNSAQVYSTDISYNIRLMENFDELSVAFCFYNSLTLTLCEYNGRFYGGGVGELVPSEFKTLRIPYKKIANKKILHLDKMMREDSTIDEIIEYVDSVVLNDLSVNELTLLKEIRKKYLSRRLKGIHIKDADLI